MRSSKSDSLIRSGPKLFGEGSRVTGRRPADTQRLTVREATPARLIVLGEVNLMMDASLLPIDKVYDAITTPAKRRKVVVRKRETADPKSIQDARSLGKELFAEMGPDGEDALFTYLQTKLKEWQVALNGYRQLADTGNYPGGTEIGEALSLIGPLLADTDSRKFVERFNGLKSDLLEVGEQFHELDHFYNHQKPAWERLRKSHGAFQLNRLELEKDEKAGPALVRMREILVAKSPYKLIKEVDALIGVVDAINSSLLAARRAQAITKIDGYVKTLNTDLAAANADVSLRATCLKPLESLRSQVEKQESLAHITQAETEAVKEFDLAQGRIEEFLRKAPVLVVSEVVQTAAFCVLNLPIKLYRPTFFDLQGGETVDKQRALISRQNRYANVTIEDLGQIPGSPLSYWVSQATLAAYEHYPPLSKRTPAKVGISTGRNHEYILFWHEVPFDLIGIGCTGRNSEFRYFPHNKAGGATRWYGEQRYVLKYSNADIARMEKLAGFRHDNADCYFRESVSWSKISPSGFVARYYPVGFTFNSAAVCIYPESPLRYLGFLN